MESPMPKVGMQPIRRSQLIAANPEHVESWLK